MKQKDDITITKEIAEEIMGTDTDFLKVAGNNIFCVNCSHVYSKNLSMKIDKYQLNYLGDIVLIGTCIKCSQPVASYIEAGEDPNKFKRAKKYIN